MNAFCLSHTARHTGEQDHENNMQAGTSKDDPKNQREKLQQTCGFPNSLSQR
jgi:hypothetical protein